MSVQPFASVRLAGVVIECCGYHYGRPRGAPDAYRVSERELERKGVFLIHQNVLANMLFPDKPDGIRRLYPLARARLIDSFFVIGARTKRSYFVHDMERTKAAITVQRLGGSVRKFALVQQEVELQKARRTAQGTHARNQLGGHVQ